MAAIDSASRAPADHVPDDVYARRWVILAVLYLALLVVGLDNTILNVALPTLVRTLHAGRRRAGTGPGGGAVDRDDRPSPPGPAHPAGRRGGGPGNCHRTTDPDVLVALLFGAVFYRVLVTGGPVVTGFAHQVAAVALEAQRTATSGPAASADKGAPARK